MLTHPYPGHGTTTSPYEVTFLPNNSDPRNPQTFTPLRKLTVTTIVALATMTVALTSSTYSGSIPSVLTTFPTASLTLATLPLSLFVLGFAIGPLLWAPISELHGRQLPFLLSLLAMSLFSAACAAAPSLPALCILRFFAGAFGSAPLTNAGGTIADMYPARQRGLALSLYAAAPFLGPSLGPLVGGFLGEAAGWRWVEGFLAVCGAVVGVVVAGTVSETYAPVLLRRRAARLTKLTGRVYRSKVEAEKNSSESIARLIRRSLLRPWVLLFREPIVLLFALYSGIVYGTLYMFFAAFPIVYQQVRGWSAGIGGLAFLGILVGMILGVVCTIPANLHYMRVQDRHGGFAPPETRLLQCMPGALAIPASQFWFAWTNGPDMHWSVSVVATVPFGWGVILIHLGIMNYLIDSYTIYAASVLAANAVLRSVFGAVFPIVAIYMYDGLGIHWAPCVPAFLSVACMPAPFLFYKYGAGIRTRCKYAAESDRFLQKLQEISVVEKGEA
ncbi:hypothetical protein FE257_009689 [Aspergillus nanangensis]|uniref:Major facilitator superfamily (MFS) profile domain-containing protein n=1 Tax=Aspergillus nanangensis TaxID=2582783 RepID=A0AAD4CJL0_ASPNN|nr:hypothetical protein FE257_009689 [Aspergillus nanangensis]